MQATQHQGDDKMNNKDESLQSIRDKSVPFGDDQAILQAFERDGYCVVTGILEVAEIQAMIDELWLSDRLLGKFERNDPTSWGHADWPQQAGGRNFLSSTQVYRDAISWDLDSNKRLLHVQQLLYKRKDIIMSGLGRLGVMRPTKSHPEWKTESSWLHWDQNPWSEPDFCRVQAIVCLTDNTATSGGFACVPGFQHEFREWGKKHPLGTVVVGGKVMDMTYGNGQPFPVPPEDACQEQIVRVVAPAGSAVLWDSRLPHQNFPNTDATAFRVVHYSMMKVRDEESARETRRLLDQKRILMDLLGEEGKRFPHQMAATARLVHCLDEESTSLEDALQEFGVDDADGLREAAKLVREAGELEEQGETNDAIKRHRQALRQFPEIEEWHEAIFS